MMFHHRSDDRGMACRTREPLARKAWERVSFTARERAKDERRSNPLPIAYGLVREITDKTWADCGPVEWQRLIEKLGGDEE